MTKFSSALKSFLCKTAMEYSVKEMTVREFYQEWLSDIDCLPVHQRVDVLMILLPKLKKDWERKIHGKHKDPRLSGSLTRKEIYQYGTQIV